MSIYEFYFNPFWPYGHDGYQHIGYFAFHYYLPLHNFYYCILINLLYSSHYICLCSQFENIFFFMHQLNLSCSNLVLANVFKCSVCMCCVFYCYVLQPGSLSVHARFQGLTGISLLLSACGTVIIIMDITSWETTVPPCSLVSCSPQVICNEWN